MGKRPPSPMTDEHIVLTVDGVREARSVHRLPREERCVTSELTKIRGLPWNGTAETLQAPIVTQQDQGPSGHRRTYLMSKIVARYGASPGCTGCMGLAPQTERSAQSESEKALADDKAKLSTAREEPKPADTPVTEPPTQTPKASTASDTKIRPVTASERPDTQRQRRSTRQERASIEGPDRTMQFRERARIDLL